MKTKQLALCLSLAAMAFGSAAKADGAFYTAANVAQAACGSDQVVWIDLDHGRYYKVGQVDTNKTTNGVYSCERTAHAKYREGKSDPTTLAKQ
jgi:hypothetical protein